jgi:hypothetical protein
MGERLRVIAKPRTRQLNIRLTAEEFERLRAACVICGAGSVSEFARSAVFRSISLATGAPVSPNDPTQWADLYHRSIERLETACRELEERLERLNRNHQDDSASSAPPNERVHRGGAKGAEGNAVGMRMAD